MICGACKKVFKVINQDDIHFKGKLEIETLSSDELDIEECELEKGDIIYYYFDIEHKEIIENSRDVCSSAMGLCLPCINDSILKTFESKVPHYGDGVYFTLNDNLNNANDEIKSCHGSYVAKRTIRVKFMIKEEFEFLKIYNTCGVLKTNEHDKVYEPRFKIFVNKDREKDLVKYMCLEEYRNGEWCCI